MKIKPGFVHITKTGGAALKKFILSNYADYFILDGVVGSTDPTHTYKTYNLEHPFAVIRDPVDRFFSMYSYWCNGSDFYRGNYFNFSIHDFIAFLRKREAPNLETEYTWRGFFFPQTHWIRPEDYGKTVFLLYKKDLSYSFLELINYFDIPYNGHNIEKFNVTSNRVNFSREFYNLSLNLRRFVEETYGTDFELYNNLLNNSHLFKKIIY